MTIGEKCPTLKTTNQHGEKIDFTNLIGKKRIVIFFYPKDFTPGCTKEACGFRDNYEVFNNLNCSVFGVSSDSEKRHLSFAKKFNLNFDLITDRDRKLSNLFQVQRNLFGLIPGRVTYIFDENGICQGVFDSLRDSDGHIEHALNTLKSLD